MVIGDSLRVADLPPREGVTILDDPDSVVANVSAPRVEEEPEPEEPEEGEELEEGEERPEGEAEEAGEPEGEAPSGDESSEG